MFRLLLITESHRRPEPLPVLIASALSQVPTGSVAVQLRDKHLPTRALGELARALLPLCQARGAPLLISDRIDLALALGLGGVHLPHDSFSPAEARRLLPADAWVGSSCHSQAELAAAKAGGASYAVLGPIFDTPSKRSYGSPLGLVALDQMALPGLPLFALGGVNAENGALAMAAGAAGLAVIRAWLDAPDPGAAVADLLATTA